MNYQLVVVSFAVLSLMIPSSSILADPIIVVEPNTIPLLGLTWCKDTVTYRIDNADKITPNALQEIRDGIDEWVHHTTDFGFTLTEVVDNPDIIIKFKKGGGRVQGHALSQSDADGCFTSVKINVSGKAFGKDNPEGQVRSITMQEVGHGLGMKHSDNKEDVMYGTVQSPPNISLSQCDIDTWKEVMHWLVDPTETIPHTPHVTEVSCGTDEVIVDGGTPTVLDIKHGITHDVSKTGSYQNRDRVHILIAVTDDAGNGVADADVHVQVDTPKTILSGDTTTNKEGIADIHYKVNAGRDGTGLFHISATADTISCVHDEPCHADFTVTK